MLPSRTIFVSAVALLLATSASAQRSSPQFSFPPPNSLASQFGADVFSTSSQDQSGANQSPLVQLGGQSLSVMGHSDQSSSSPQPQQPAAPKAQESAQQQPSIQLSRPSLSLTSLTTSQQVSRQSQAPSSQSSLSQLSSSSSGSSSSSSGSSAAASSVSANREPAAHQSSRHHAQAPTPAHRPASQQHHAPAPAGHHGQHQQHHQHHHNQQQHPSNLQTQQTSQSMNAQSNQAAIEAARRAEATAASLAAASGQNYHCPDSFGFFRHHKSCDKYWACENGTAALKLCGNGLMFDDSDPKRENCAYPFSVDCGADRTDLEPPISTPHCPRLYGLFADSANCRVFYSCWNGESSKYECPPGLAYDNEQRVCVWADLVERCDQSEVSDGFVCPDPTEVDQPGHYTRHAHPTDCRKFYVCIEGVARPYGCSLGTVFNVDSLQCDEPENVSGCEKYYGEMDPKLAKKLAREGVQGSSSGGQTGSSGATSTRGSSTQTSQTGR